MNTFRRRRYIVDRALQYRLLVYNAIYFVIIVLSIGLALFLPLYFQLSNPALSAAQQGELAGRVLYLHGNLWPAVLVVFIILSMHSILISHRIAGPLYRFRQTFQQIISGDISKMVNIRKGDLLANEQEKIAEMMAMLQSRIGKIRREQAAVEKVVEDLLGNPENPMEEGLKAKIAKIQVHNMALKKEVEYFKLSDDAAAHNP
jgi:methyl-accepting chemotaxis protein